MLDEQSVDFIDIVSSVESHVPVARVALERGIATICQKPLAESLAAARAISDFATQQAVKLLVHENWRWQTPLRKVKQILESGRLGQIVRARIDYANSFPVFENQPALKEMTQFILTDIGTHILDVSRFLFGEASELYCQTRRMRPDIRGEDVATVMMRKESGFTVTCNMSYASKWEYDRFPQTMVAVEGTAGGLTLGNDYQIRLVDQNGDEEISVPIPQYAWANPDYALIHSSIVDCHRNLLADLAGENPAETTAADNLRTLQLVYAAYDSASHDSVQKLAEFQ